MYDSKSEPREFLGDDAADATAKAASYFGLEASALVVREAKNVSGLGGRVIVVAHPAGAARPSFSGGGDRDRGREPRAREERGGRDRGGRDGGRERGGRDRGGRGGRERGGRDRDRGDRGGREFGSRERERDEAPEPAPEPEGPSIGTARGELGAVGDYVKGLIERMELG